MNGLNDMSQIITSSSTSPLTVAGAGIVARMITTCCNLQSVCKVIHLAHLAEQTAGRDAHPLPLVVTKAAHLPLDFSETQKYFLGSPTTQKNYF